MGKSYEDFIESKCYIMGCSGRYFLKKKNSEKLLETENFI